MDQRFPILPMAKPFGPNGLPGNMFWVTGHGSRSTDPNSRIQKKPSDALKSQEFGEWKPKRMCFFFEYGE